MSNSGQVEELPELPAISDSLGRVNTVCRGATNEAENIINLLNGRDRCNSNRHGSQHRVYIDACRHQCRIVNAESCLIVNLLSAVATLMAKKRSVRFALKLDVPHSCDG